jgi:hypothetical protein
MEMLTQPTAKALLLRPLQAGAIDEESLHTVTDVDLEGFPFCEQVSSESKTI